MDFQDCFRFSIIRPFFPRRLCFDAFHCCSLSVQPFRKGTKYISRWTGPGHGSLFSPIDPRRRQQEKYDEYVDDRVCTKLPKIFFFVPRQFLRRVHSSQKIMHPLFSHNKGLLGPWYIWGGPSMGLAVSSLFATTAKTIEFNLLVSRPSTLSGLGRKFWVIEAKKARTGRTPHAFVLYF